MMMARDFTRVSRTGAKDIGIWPLLVWAFRTECAQLELAGGRDKLGHGYGYASMTSIIAQHEQLGCRIDGGGRSDPHPDADLVAAAVAVLPEGCGGGQMGLQIAELARADIVPGWQVETAIVAREWLQRRSGLFARTADAADLGPQGWPPQERQRRKGGTVAEPVMYCPVAIRGTASEVASKRRNYLLWWSALLELRTTFQLGGDLSAWNVTAAMPPRQPWKMQ